MKKQERAAIQCVADQFSASWEVGDGPPDAWLTVAGKRIAVEIATVKQWRAAATGHVKPRLRFDKVARGLVERLQTALMDAVPDGRTVIVTVTAPIRQDSKTTAALERTIRAALNGRAARADIEETIRGNRIRVRVTKAGPAQAPKLVGYVHNPDPGADQVLLDCTEALLACLAAATGGRAKLPGESWLIIVNGNAFPPIETWRQICALLSASTGFKTILMLPGTAGVPPALHGVRNTCTPRSR